MVSLVTRLGWYSEDGKLLEAEALLKQKPPYDELYHPFIPHTTQDASGAHIIIHFSRSSSACLAENQIHS